MASARSDGEFQLELPMRPEVFEVALHYYDPAGVIVCPPDVDVAEVVDACDYLMIPATTRTIACRNLGANRGASTRLGLWIVCDAPL